MDWNNIIRLVCYTIAVGIVVHAVWTGGVLWGQISLYDRFHKKEGRTQAEKEDLMSFLRLGK